ncbi:MAG TPA: hypothetical protein VM326_04575 [Sphingomicrobium sp.]|nr:hypothetical protein [Sphingomicrobium sp.]
MAVFLTSCADDAQHLPLVIDGAVYAVPESHVQSRADAPFRFVRIKPPDRPFELVFDSRSLKRTDRNGWPVIFSLNDGTAPNIDYAESGDIKIVCVRASAPGGGCGFKLSDQGTEWTVFFPQMLLSSAGKIQEEAVLQLQTYRRGT